MQRLPRESLRPVELDVGRFLAADDVRHERNVRDRQAQRLDSREALLVGERRHALAQRVERLVQVEHATSLADVGGTTLRHRRYAATLRLAAAQRHAGAARVDGGGGCCNGSGGGDGGGVVADRQGERRMVRGPFLRFRSRKTVFLIAVVAVYLLVLLFLFLLRMLMVMVIRMVVMMVVHI